LRCRFVALAFLSLLLACSRSGDLLPGLGINGDEVSVSGLSAGAYMAGQLHVAHSKQIVGAGIVAGGTREALWERHKSRLAFPAGLPFFGGE
jgi:hypothetical protein